MSQGGFASSTPFIVIDGQDGSGKGTQIALLKERFEKGGVKAVFTREPGGTILSELQREVIKSPEGMSADSLTQFLMFWAARSAWMQQLVLPALKNHIPVISDRGDSSTYAYQIIAKDAPHLETEFWRMRKLVFVGVYPKAYIFIDVPPEVARDRALASENHTSVFDKEKIEFYEKVRSGFRLFAERVDTQIFFVDGSRSREDVHEEVYGIVASLFGWN